MDTKSIKALEEAIGAAHQNMTGIRVQKDGSVAYEAYFHGFDADRAVHVYSVTKSVFSALIGIALDQGLIKSVDQPVLDFFPAYAVPAGNKTIRAVTLRHLLTMTAPYQCDVEPYEAFFESESWMQFALGLLGGTVQPGTFRYSPIVGAHLLSGILVQATGRPVLDFATESLFAPLGISVPQSIYLRSRAEHMAFGAGENASGWAADPQGINTASWGLCLTPRDMTKLGQLYLDGGVYGGQQIVSTAWVQESTREHSRWAQMNLAYGYLWWVLDGKAQVYAAMGDGGNVLYVNTAKRLVVSIASLFMPDAADRLGLIHSHIEPLFEA